MLAPTFLRQGSEIADITRSPWWGQAGAGGGRGRPGIAGLETTCQTDGARARARGRPGSSCAAGPPSAWVWPLLTVGGMRRGTRLGHSGGEAGESSEQDLATPKRGREVKGRQALATAQQLDKDTERRRGQCSAMASTASSAVTRAPRPAAAVTPERCCGDASSPSCSCPAHGRMTSSSTVTRARPAPPQRRRLNHFHSHEPWRSGRAKPVRIGDHTRQSLDGPTSGPNRVHGSARRMPRSAADRLPMAPALPGMRADKSPMQGQDGPPRKKHTACDPHDSPAPRIG